MTAGGATKRVVAAILVGGAVATAACSGSPAPRLSKSSGVDLEVFAASSLTDAFQELGDAYSSAHRGVTFTFNFLSSTDLATQLERGAAADVFASADTATMDRVVDAGLTATDPRIFVANRLEIIVPSGNPGRVRSFSDLERDDLVIALCSPHCPAGKYASEALSKAGLDVSADSLEPDVRAVVTRVQLGEADAGIVYASDVAAAKQGIEGIDIPASSNIIASYPIAALEGSPPQARSFVRFVLSPEGQKTLVDHGFLRRGG